MLRIDRAKILGSGGYGVVFEGHWCEIKVAIKRILKNNAASSRREEDALKKLNHDNIIKLFHVDEDPDFKCFVLELCIASLDKLFLQEDDPKKYRGPMPPEEEVLLQLAKGLEHIHENQLIHRNIKPANVLIWVNSEKNKILIKWAGFSVSKPVNERGTCSMSGIKGTINWLAPEILKLIDEVPTTEGRQRGTVKSDVFAEGLVFGYILMGGVHPYGTSSFEISVNIRTKEPVNLPENEEYKSIILKMLQKEPENRISSSDVVNEVVKIKPKHAIVVPEKSSVVSMLKIDRTKVLGNGGYGVVFEGHWCEIKVAIKRIPIEHAASNKQEEDALKKLNHDNIIKLFHVDEDPDFKRFVLELCNASLDKLFLQEDDPKKYRGPMPPDEEVLLQLAKGLEHIHENQLVHRDIKPENVLIWANPEKKKILMKWADFGLSKSVNERETYSMSGVQGTTNWLAPEILKLMDADPINKEKKRGTVKSDVFAEGLVFGYVLMGGVHPFGTSSFQISVNLRTKEPVNLPKKEEYKSIILKMFQKEPENRISSSDVVKQLKLWLNINLI